MIGESFFQLDTLNMPSVYAMFSALGTWQEGKMCKTCGQHRSNLVEPLLVEWDPGTDQIGDFSRGGSECLVTDRVKKFMQSTRYNVHFSTGIQYQKFKWTERLGGRHKRVKFPYEGPQLYWLGAIDHVDIDIKKSNIIQDSDCPTCGRTRIKVRRTGLHIDRKNWNGEKLFTVNQFNNSSIRFISSEARVELQREGFTNFAAPLAGAIGD